MRTWSLKIGDPLSLTLAADARLNDVDYNDDQIWELTLRGGEPSALSIDTTYGLRAVAMRIFPRFCEGDMVRLDPAEFDQPPTLRHFYPNYLHLTYTPLPDLDVDTEYWVPQSNGIVGRLRLTNRRSTPRQIDLEIIALLTPNNGQRMAAAEIQGAPLLKGESEAIFPVLFVTGGAKPGGGPYPALTLTFKLSDGATEHVIWSHAACPDVQESFNLARALAARPWEAEIARTTLLNAGQVEVYTGNTDWDAAFAFSQKVASGLLISSTTQLPYTSFVLTRQPDQGYSRRRDGSDYNHLWNGQPPLEADYLASFLLPAFPRLAQGLLLNFLSTQTEDGSIDWKPGLAGQRSRLLATPILANFAWRIYNVTEERAFLEQVFPPLLRFFQAWFTPGQDEDGDGLPEWDHPNQAGVEDHPLYARWHEWSLGLDIRTAESAALNACLYRESQVLISMAHVLGQTTFIPELQTRAAMLQAALQTAWDEQQAAFFDQDRDTHDIRPPEWLGERLGSGEFHLQRSFDIPARLLIRVQTNGETTRRPQVFIHGSSASGQHRVERIGDEHFRWYLGQGLLTIERLYSSIEHIELRGLSDGDHVQFYRAGYRYLEQSTLLPLWAGAIDTPTAGSLVRQTITNPQCFWRSFGLPAAANNPDGSFTPTHVHLVWNALIGEGLLRYDYRAEAAELIEHCMAAVIQNLKSDAAFRRYYDSESGSGSGERNALDGLAPLGLFLDVLGVNLISSDKVELQGINPFPWPVTVKYRGLTVLRQKDKTTVIFPDGQTIEVSDPTACIVALQTEPTHGKR